MFLENAAMLLITFCFSFPGLCFALNKNSMKTPAHVTGTHLLCGGTQQHFFFSVLFMQPKVLCKSGRAGQCEECSELQGEGAHSQQQSGVHAPPEG